MSAEFFTVTKSGTFEWRQLEFDDGVTGDDLRLGSVGKGQGCESFLYGKGPDV